MPDRIRTARTRSAVALLAVVVFAPWAAPQNSVPAESSTQAGAASPSVTTDDYNRRLTQLKQSLAGPVVNSTAEDYRIGPQDLLEITIFEASELNRTVRVSASGEISLPLIGGVQAAGLTPKSLELVLEELLRHSYMKDPHVSVFTREMHSHPVSVFGAVKKPGVFQIDGPKSLIEMLSMAEGLAEDAGDTVIVMRGAGLSAAQQSALNTPAPNAKLGDTPEDQAGVTTVQSSLKHLLESGDTSYNVLVYPGDVVKVTRAGVVYVEGDVKKPGGFLLKTNENISVLQAVALAEGLTRTAAGSHARVIRTNDATGARTELPIDLDKLLAGGHTDMMLRPNDIVFVPNSTGKSVFYGSAQAAVSLGSAAVYRW